MKKLKIIEKLKFQLIKKNEKKLKLMSWKYLNQF